MDEYLSSCWLGNITTTICREGFTCSLMALMYVSIRSLGSSSTMGSLTCNREYIDCDTYLHQLHHDNYSTCTNPHSHTNCSFFLHHSTLFNHITTTHTNPIPPMQHYPLSSSTLPTQLHTYPSQHYYCFLECVNSW